MPPRTFDHEDNKSMEDDEVICRFCGEPDCIIANYTEEVWGTAVVMTRDGELDDYETGAGENFHVRGYRCTNCNEERDSLEDIILPEGEIFNEN